MRRINGHPHVFSGPAAFDLPQQLTRATRRARFTRQSELPRRRLWYLDVYEDFDQPGAFVIHHHTHDVTEGLTVGWLEGWMSGDELRSRLPGIEEHLP